MRQCPSIAAVLLLLGCRATTSAQPATPEPRPALTADQLGPPESMVRADLDCPDGEIEYLGGLGTSTQVVVRTLRACGTNAEYVWSADGWARKTADSAE